MKLISIVVRNNYVSFLLLLQCYCTAWMFTVSSHLLLLVLWGSSASGDVRSISGRVNIHDREGRG